MRFEVVQPNPSGENNFYVQLDGQAPVTLETTEYTFKGLRPGMHNVVVTEIDANGTPIPSSRATVQFQVAQPQTGHTADGNTGPISNNQLREISSVFDGAAGPNSAASKITTPVPDELSGKNGGLPSTGSALPILSVVGFGVLVFGVVGAIRRARAR